MIGVQPDPEDSGFTVEAVGGAGRWGDLSRALSGEDSGQGQDQKGLGRVLGACWGHFPPPALNFRVRQYVPPTPQTH